MVEEKKDEKVNKKAEEKTKKHIDSAAKEAKTTERHDQNNDKKPDDKSSAKDETSKKETSSEDEARKKEFRKNLIIAIIAIVGTVGVVLAVLIPMGVFTSGSARPELLPESMEETTNTDTTTQEDDYTSDYYNYIQEQDVLRTKFDQMAVEEYEIGFIDVAELDEPVMVINGVYENEQSVKYLYKKNGGVAISTYAAPSEIKYLYDKNNNDYAYFVEQPLYNNMTRYVNVGQYAKDPGSKNAITISDNEFREYFNDTEAEIDYVSLDKDATDTELKEAIHEANEMFKKSTDDTEIEASVGDDEDDLDFVVLEGNSLHYGKYQWKEYNTYTKQDEVIDELIINSDGTCAYNGDSKCIWTIGSADFAQSIESMGKNIHDTIEIHYGADNYEMNFYAYEDDTLTDGDMMLLKYIEE